MPIVEATFVAANAKDAMGRTDRRLSQRLEQAMVKAAADCCAAGITDPAVIKDRMMAAYRAERARG